MQEKRHKLFCNNFEILLLNLYHNNLWEIVYAKIKGKWYVC